MKSPERRPLIGITVGTGHPWRLDGEYFRTYASAVERVGGACVRLGAYPSSFFECCDGFLIPGGWDVTPHSYERLPGDGALGADELMGKYRIQCEPKRDSYELKLIREAVKSGKPVLAICRGIQALNVVLAGKLLPDIRTCMPDALTHRSTGKGPSLFHEVTLEPDSIVGRAYGERTVTVNTRHHQGLLPEMIPENLRITAMAPDGIVEAVEGKTSRFIVGVQWHPERWRDPSFHERSVPLFEVFVEACNDRKES